MKLGYARVSTEEQSLAVQVEQLKKAGCQRIHTEKQSAKGYTWRSELNRALEYFELPRRRQDEQTPDILVVTKLDRLARNTKDLLEILERIGKAGASFVSLAEPWADTTSPSGKLIMTVFAGVAQFERERMMERCREGRERAKRNGVKLGPKPKLTAHQQREALKRMRAGDHPREIAKDFNVHRATIYRFKKAVQAGTYPSLYWMLK